jgi:hypothetical protein
MTNSIESIVAAVTTANKSDINAQAIVQTINNVGAISGKKQAVAVKIFNANLPTMLANGYTTAWRTHVVQQIMVANQTTLGSASTAYNFAKKQAVALGMCEDFSRSGNMAKNAPAITPEAQQAALVALMEAQARALADSQAKMALILAEQKAQADKLAQEIREVEEAAIEAAKAEREARKTAAIEALASLASGEQVAPDVETQPAPTVETVAVEPKAPARKPRNKKVVNA